MNHLEWRFGLTKETGLIEWLYYKVTQSITMREIMNISLPKEMVMQIKKGAKEGGFATTSEFMRSLIRAWNMHKILEEVKKADKENKWKKLPKGVRLK